MNVFIFGLYNNHVHGQQVRAGGSIGLVLDYHAWRSRDTVTEIGGLSGS